MSDFFLPGQLSKEILKYGICEILETTNTCIQE